MHTTTAYTTRRSSVSTALSVAFAVIAMVVIAGKARATDPAPARHGDATTAGLPIGEEAAQPEACDSTH